MKKSHKSFIVLSLVIALLEVAFVAHNYRQQKLALEESLREKILQVHSSFDLALLGSRQRMSEIASYVAHSPAIQQAFLAGRKAVEREGGGPGGAEASAARAELLALSQQSWQELHSSFDFQQMHYHLPGKVTSFLRVQNPEKFGDLLIPFRHMLVAAHERKSIVSGIETGSSETAIRGVAPVFAFDSRAGREVYVGTLEFATSLGQTIATLAENQGVELAILLNKEELEKTLWSDALQEKISKKSLIDGFLIEEATFPSAQSFLQKENVNSLLGPRAMTLHPDSSGYHWLASFPLRDYWGEQDLLRPAVGQVVISRDATKSVLALHGSLLSNMIIAFLGFLLIEIFLWQALRLTTRTLERMVVNGRAELAVKNLELEDELVERKKLQQQREDLIQELLETMEDVKALSGLLPICAYCKKIRDDEGYWRRLESYIESHSSAQFSHGICSDCLEEHFPEAKDEVCGSHLVEGAMKLR